VRQLYVRQEASSRRVLRIYETAVTADTKGAAFEFNQADCEQSGLTQTEDLFIQFGERGCQHLPEARVARRLKLLENALARESHSLQLAEPRSLFGR
jgi:hypothetical protein